MKAARDLRELIGYRELIGVLARREIRARYRYSLLGAGWAVALPVSLMLIFSVVFSRVANFQTGGIPYPVFAYAGLLPWQLHAGILTGGARSLTDNTVLVTKVYFAREVLPLSRVVAALFDFLIASVVLAGLMVWYGITPGPGAALLPLVLLMQLSFGVGLAMFIAGANLLYRDVQYVLQVGITVWMFASSVVYPLPRQGALGWIGYFNPITPILDTYRALLLGAPAPHMGQLAAAVAISAATPIAAWLWFRRVERRFGELA
ncbi:MAG: ABC transporter permease [Planctomycetes bacterium]|nr:ABC transporter permease [Planctomycetota bacterium]